MKKRTSIWMLIALAAMALVFAGACSDGSDDGSGGGSGPTNINLTYFKAFVESLGTVESGIEGEGWSFAGGTWSDLEYTLAGSGSGSASAAVSASTVLGKVQGLGEKTSSDGLLTVDFRSVGWSGTAPSGNATSGSIKVTVKLVESASEDSYTIDSNETLLSGLSGDGVEVTLVFTRTLVTSGNWS